MIVNSHTHLEFTGFAHLCPTEPVEFVSWLRTVIATREQRKSIEVLAKQNAIEKGIQALLDAGTTHVGDISQTCARGPKRQWRCMPGLSMHRQCGGCWK